MKVTTLLRALLVFVTLCGGAWGEPQFSKATILSRGEAPGAYAIPKIVTLPDDTAIIVLQDRQGGDYGKLIRPLYLRSTDGGVTWSDPSLLVPEDFPRLGDTLVNPTGIVVDRERGRVLLFISQTPMQDESGQIISEKDFYENIQATRALGRGWFLVTSDDSGQTWSPPEPVTDTLIKQPHWQAWSPIHSGIQLQYGKHKGRLVVPVRCYCPDADPSPHDWKYQFNATIYSDDGGVTWTPGGRAGPYLGECAIAEREDGTIHMNQRALPGREGVRWATVSHDGGATFGAPEATDLSDVRCHVGLLQTSTKDIFDSELLLLSSIPGTERKGLTLSVSERNGLHWERARVIEPGPAAYSDLAELSDGTILCLYETGDNDSRKDLALARFNIEWVLAGLMETRFDDLARMECVFSVEKGERSFDYMMSLFEAHARLHETFVGKSNLGDYDPGTNHNPLTFVGGNNVDRLPDDAVISISLSKQEFAELKMPGWEGIALGGPNHSAYLKAWMAYQCYENARLNRELLKLKGSPDAEALKPLEEEMARQRKIVVDYLNTPPAD